mgnify:CR=1 FL=1
MINKTNYNDAIFLLGGHDLEMLEIMEMLESKKITVPVENYC